MNEFDDKTLAAIAKVEHNINFERYERLSNEESELVRKAYKTHLKAHLFILPTDNFENEEKTIVAKGYSRIVFGDYGIYVEFTSKQIQLQNLENKFEGKPTRKVKYIWMQTKDDALTKIYWQKARVSYADYIPGMYYVSPSDLYLDGERLYNPITELGVV